MLMSAGLGLTTSSRTDLCSVQMIHDVKQVQYVELQEDHIFFVSLFLQPFNKT